MPTTKKLEWAAVEGRRGFFSKTAEAPNMKDPSIRRAVEDLKRQFDAIAEAVDKRSHRKYLLYGFSRKR